MTQATVDAVKAALKAVKEPILGRDIVSLGMVKKVEVEKDFAYIQIDLPTPAYRDRQALAGHARRGRRPFPSSRGRHRA